MKWCCAVFQDHFAEAGSRGFGIFLVDSDREDPGFIFQFRAMDAGATAPICETPLSIVSDVHVHFCPWCGVKLARFYRKHYRELDRSELRVPLL